MKKYSISAIIFFLIVMFGLNFPIKIAKAAFAISGSNSFTGTVSAAMPITDLQITGTGSEPIPVKLRVTSGTLAMSTTTGLTFTGGTTGATLQFSGSLTNVNNALATLTYTRGSAGSDTLEVSLVNPGEVFFEDNGHLYKYISGNISWTSAQTAAAGLTAYDSAGYLATITSSAENAFVAARLGGDGWFGASDTAVEGAWRWVTGPEAGTQFWSGTGGGSTVGGNYANWAPGEPNDSGNEDCAQFYISSNNWNDLPCSHTLGGYIVEFGADGDLPSVAAKNISITTSSSPTVSTLSPADNATNVSTTANLVMTFSQTVTTDTGDVVIKKTSDDTTVETIPVSGLLVTGSGSATITINPSTTLDESTGYYVQVPNTAFKNGSDVYYAGIANTTSWNFTTGDFTAPVISDVVVTPSNTSSTITWTTNELSSTLVEYGLTSSLGSSTAETDTAPRVLSHSKNLTSLLECTTYYYEATSKDAANNTTSTSTGYFTTTGCQESETPQATSSLDIPIADGGQSSLTSGDNTINVTFPENSTTEGMSGSLTIQIHALDNEGILTTLGKPSSSPHEVGPILFDVKAIIDGTTILDSFDAPVTIEYEYTDEDIAGLRESSLWLYHYHDNEWQRLEDCTIDEPANTISCNTDSFSLFALFGSTGVSSSGSMTSHSKGSNIIIKDGTVYTITSDGYRRPYTSAGAFLSYGFNNWANVVAARDADLKIPVGSFIPPRDGSIICSDRSPDKGTCYLITTGKKSGFTSETIFKNQGFSFDNALFGDVSFLSSTTDIDNADQAHKTGVLINNKGTLQIVGPEGLIGIPSMAVLESWGYTVKTAVSANTWDMALPTTTVLGNRPAGVISAF